MNPAICVVVNRSGGTAKKMGDKLGEALDKAFAAAGARAEVALVEGDALARSIRAVADRPVVAVGGGDGTQGCAAALLKDRDAALAVLPLGTLNHLAKELGVPADLDAAAEVAVRGRRKAIDLGSVDGTVFVNNASIGLYTRLVRHRDAMRLPKALATIPAAWGIVRRMHVHPIRIALGDGEPQWIVTPLLFIGNNRYEYQGRRLGRRDSLTDGVLSVYAVAPRSVPGLLGFAMRALLGRADPERDFLALGEFDRVTVMGEGTIDVARDGEVARMNLPLHFRTLPRALTVMVPDPSVS